MIFKLNKVVTLSAVDAVASDWTYEQLVSIQHYLNLVCI